MGGTRVTAGAPLKRITYDELYAKMTEGLPTTVVDQGPYRGSQPLLSVNLSQSQDNLLLALVSAWAEVGDVLSFYNERASASGYYETSDRPDCVYALTHSVGVAPPPATSATARLAFVIKDPPGQTGTYQLPAGTTIQAVTPTPSDGDGSSDSGSATTSAPAVFETLSPCTVDAAWSAAKSAFDLPHPKTVLLKPGQTVTLRTRTTPAPKKGTQLLLSGIYTEFTELADLPPASNNQHDSVALLTVTSTATGPLSGTTDLTCSWTPTSDTTQAKGLAIQVREPLVQVLGTPQALLGATARDWSALTSSAQANARLPRGGVGVLWTDDDKDLLAGRANAGLTQPQYTGLVLTQPGTAVLATNGQGVYLTTFKALQIASSTARDALDGSWGPWQEGFYDSANAPAPTTWRAPKTPPTGNVVLCMAYDPATGSLFAGAPRGALYRSEDDGDTWVNIQQGLTVVKANTATPPAYQTLQYSIPRGSSVWAVAAVQDVVVAATDAGLFVANLASPQQQGLWWQPLTGGLGVYAFPGTLSTLSDAQLLSELLSIPTEQATDKLSATGGESIPRTYTSATVAIGYGSTSSDSPAQATIVIGAGTSLYGLLITSNPDTLYWETVSKQNTNGVVISIVQAGPSTGFAAATSQDIYYSENSIGWSTVTGELTLITALAWDGSTVVAAATHPTDGTGLYQRADFDPLSNATWTKLFADKAYGEVSFVARDLATQTTVVTRPPATAEEPPPATTWPGGLVPLSLPSWNLTHPPDQTQPGIFWTAKKQSGLKNPGTAVLIAASDGDQGDTDVSQYVQTHPILDVSQESVTLFGSSTTTTRVTVGPLEQFMQFDVRSSQVAFAGAKLDLAPLAVHHTDVYFGGTFPLQASIRTPMTGQDVYITGKRMRVDISQTTTKFTPFPSDSTGRLDPNLSPPQDPPSVLYVVRFIPQIGTELDPTAAAHIEQSPSNGARWLLQEPTGQYYVAFTADCEVPITWPEDTDPQVVVHTKTRAIPGIDASDPPPVVDTLSLAPFSTWLYRQAPTINLNVVPASHGRSLRNRVLGSGNSGQANQTFTLPQKDVSNDDASGSTLSITVSGLLWTETPSLASSGSADQVYTTTVQPDGTTAIEFGDGEHGARLPTGRNNVIANYRSGSGNQGNVGPGVLTLLRVKPLFVKSVTNPEAAVGGAAAANPTVVKSTSLQALTTLSRIVTIDDYPMAALDVPGVAYAAARRWGNRNVGVTVVAEESYRSEPMALAKRVHDALISRQAPLIGVQLAVGLAIDATFVVKTQVVATQGTQYRRAVRAALLDAFGPVRRLGVMVYKADVQRVISSVEGILSVGETTLTSQTPDQRRAQTAPNDFADELPQAISPAEGSYEVTVYPPKMRRFEPLTLWVVSNAVQFEELSLLKPVDS